MKGTTVVALVALLAGAACAGVSQPLADLFEATGGRSWHRSDGWLGSGHHCTWYGVACNADAEVTGLFLSSNNLRGTVPVTLPNLTSLVVLDVEANALMGPLPKNFGQLVKLQALNLRFNALNGPLPLDGLRELRYVEVDYNRFSGDLTSLAASAPTIQVISATANTLNGTIGTTANVLRDSTSLRVLQLGSNEIEGDVGQLQLAASVEVVDLSRNKISGHLPRNFRSATPRLSELLLFGNGIRGPVPSAFPDTLRVVDLHGNRASGQLPAQLASVAFLETLHVQQNELGGLLPEDFASSPALDIDLSGNKFLCPLPLLPEKAKADCTKLLMHRVVPDYAPLGGGGEVVVQGENFYSARGLSCKFGSVNSPATVLDESRVSCPVPSRSKPGTVELSLSLNGVRVSNNTLPFSYAARKRQVIINPNNTRPPIPVVIAGTSMSAPTVSLFSAMAPVEEALGTSGAQIMDVQVAWVAVEDPEYPSGVWSRHGQLEASRNALVSCYMLQVSAYRGISLPPCLFVNNTNPDPRQQPPCAFERRQGGSSDAALTWARMRACAHSGLGKGYLLNSARLAKSIGATDTALYVNGKQLCVGNCPLASSDILRTVCDAYDGDKPAACL